MKCSTDKKQFSGKYQLEHKTDYGYAHFHKGMLKGNHHLVILPTVADVSPASGYGEMLTIKGTGFAEDKSRIKVQVDNRNCLVKTVAYDKIECRLANEQEESSKLETNTNSTQ